MSNQTTRDRAKWIIRQALSDWTRSQPQMGPHEATGAILAALDAAGIGLVDKTKMVTRSKPNANTMRSERRKHERAIEDDAAGVME
jgi:hypothetical protein